MTTRYQPTIFVWMTKAPGTMNKVDRHHIAAPTTDGTQNGLLRFGDQGRSSDTWRLADDLAQTWDALLADHVKKPRSPLDSHETKITKWRSRDTEKLSEYSGFTNHLVGPPVICDVSREEDWESICGIIEATSAEDGVDGAE